MGASKRRRLVTFTAIAGTGAVLTWQVRRKWSDARPVRTALELLGERSPGGSGGVAKAIHKFAYEQISSRMDEQGTSFLNYGYSPLEPPYAVIELSSELEANRYSAQMYHRVASGAELEGKDVLEVGCGRGGGASFVHERFRPSSMVAIDLAEKAIAHCRTEHGRAGLEFRTGDAENLPFEDASFDAVLNVESSHCYPNIEQFFSEVFRVLRPGGHLLMADLRDEDPTGATPSLSAALAQQIADAGFEIVEQEDVTRNVVRSLELDTDHRQALVDKYAPKFVRAQVLDFAGVVGSKVYQSFDTGHLSYTRFVARKPALVGAATASS